MISAKLFVLVGISIACADNTADYEVRTVSECYGKPMPVSCDDGFQVRVLHALYQQTKACAGSFFSELCQRREPGNPACVGNSSCIFPAPWVYLSEECGYSNSFAVIYQCIPDELQKDICATAAVRQSSGYLVSPSYPLPYPPSQHCSTMITANPGQRIQFLVIDIYLAFYTDAKSKRCIDTLSIIDDATHGRTAYLCSGKHRDFTYTSTSHKAGVQFHSADHVFSNAKGFWLHYKVIDDVQETPKVEEVSTLSVKPSSHDVTTQTSLVDLFFAKDNTPWYLKYATQPPAAAGTSSDHLAPIRSSADLSQPPADDNHPMLIFDMIPDRRPQPPNEPPKPANHHQSSKSSIFISLSAHEIGAIAGGAACFIGLVIALVVIVAIQKRRTTKTIDQKGQSRVKKPFKDVILAYEPDENSQNSRTMHITLPDSAMDKKSQAKNPMGNWSTWTTGLGPIDETIEDLYTEVKRCDLDPERTKVKAKFIRGRSRSKSLDDLLARSQHRGESANQQISLSLDSLDCSTHSIPLTNVTSSCCMNYSDLDDSEMDPEYYERLDQMYSDVALAHTRARAQQYEDLRHELDTISWTVTPLSGSPYIHLHRSPSLSHCSPIDTPFEMTLLDNEDIDIAL